MPRPSGRVVTAARRAHRYGAESDILLLSTLVGAIAGLGALVFTWALELATRVFLIGIGGYTPAAALGEGGGEPASDFTRPWAIPLTVALGALISAILVQWLAPGGRGARH